MRVAYRAVAWLIVALSSVGGVVHASAQSAEHGARGQVPAERTVRRASGRGWSIHVDNDLFAFTREDGDYTAGVSVTLGGDTTLSKPLSAALDWIDGRTGFGESSAGDATFRSFEAGLLLFTPQNLEATEPLPDDRPYGNLAYLSSSRLTHVPASPVARQSSLTVGILGSPLIARLHESVHEAIGSRIPMGYRYQVSDGGEPTFRYAVSSYRVLDSGAYAGQPYHLRLGVSGSVGYLTEASAELALRWGDLDTPWWSSLPSVSEYAGHPPIRLAGDAERATRPRFQLAAGVKVRLRLYNSFLQGQFRSSSVTHSSERLDPLLVEAWLGLTTVFKNDLSVSYTLRHQTAELEAGAGARDFTWAGISFAQQF